MAFDVRTITELELDRFIDTVRTGFGGDPDQGEEERIREVIGLDRTHAAFDGDRIVGTMASYELGLSVPGGADIAAAGLTRVTVAATHRRRGILGRLMEAHVADAKDNGEIVSCLWASEVAIYGRFGYGMATDTVGVDIDTVAAGIAEPDNPDTVEMIDLDEAKAMLPDLQQRISRHRPGLLTRSERWWTKRTLADHGFMRDGASAMRRLVAKRSDQPVGYVLYRQKPSWTEDAMPNGTVTVVELLAVDPVAEQTLWSYLTNIDLFTTVTAWTQPSDSVVPHLATNIRAVRRKTSDGLFVRIIDVAAALTARRYDRPGRLVLAVHGPEAGGHAVTGTYRLSIDRDGVASCEPTDAGPEVTISADGLGSLYLGAVDRGKITGLQLRRHLDGGAEAIDRLVRCFAWPVAPWCNEEF